jgi:hypothetical protein
MLSAEFEPPMPAVKELQTYNLSHTVTGIGIRVSLILYKVALVYAMKVYGRL